MTRQVIQLGSAANSGTGDPLTTAFGKVNANFQDLYAADPFGGTTANVVSFGADPVGAKDSTTAVQNAIASLPTTGGRLYFPAGSYLITSLTVPNPILIFGDGFGISHIYSNSATADTFSVTASNSVTFRDLAFNNNVTRTAGSYINFTSTTSLAAVEDCYMVGWFIGITMNGAGDYTLWRCKFTNGVATNGVAISVGQGTPPSGGAPNVVHIISVAVDNPAGAKPAAGIQIGQTGEVHMIGCDFLHCNYGCMVIPTGTQVAASVYAIRTHFDNGGAGCVLMQPQAAGATIQRVSFNSCWGSSSAGTGMIFDTATNGGTIDGVTLMDMEGFANTNNGITMTGIGTKNIQIATGKFAGNGGNGIEVGAGVTKFSIREARIGPCGGFLGNTGVGIKIDTGASDFFSITNNDLVGNTGGAFTNGGSGANITISGNAGYNPVASTSISVTASPFTWTNNTGTTATLLITGGTVSSVTLAGGQVAAATNVSLSVPQGSSAVVTYSSAPTMNYLGT